MAGKETEWIYIFGAHSRAQTLGEYLRCLEPDLRIAAYLFGNGEENPQEVNGVPVLDMGENPKLNRDYPVYIGTRGVYHAQITERLRKYGMKKIIPITAELDMELRNRYLKQHFEKIGRGFEKIDDFTAGESGCGSVTANACVYVVKSAFDKPLQQPYTLAAYEKTIQAGAALTDKRLPEAEFTDDAGENISAKNRQYCELTALYWIWKHAGEEIVGLAHYRRHFLLPSDWLLRMEMNKIDVILPTPLYVAPSLEGNFKKRHDPSDWDYMMRLLKERSEEEYQQAKEYFQGSLYSPCNMFIMRKRVLDDLCAWLFPILDAAEEHGGQKADSYLNRYPGFLSERLMTFFFEKHRETYKVVYADKNFLP